MSEQEPDSLFDDDSMEDSSGVMDDFSSADPPEDFDDSSEAGEIGLSSEEAAEAEAEEEATGAAAAGSKKNFNIYDAMLLMSLIFILLATLKMFLELQTFGNIFSGFPWRVAL